MDEANLDLAEKAKLNTWTNRAAYSTRAAYGNAFAESKNRIKRENEKK